MIIPHDYCGKGVLLRRVFVAILLTALEGLESFDRFENRTWRAFLYNDHVFCWLYQWCNGNASVIQGSTIVVIGISIGSNGTTYADQCVSMLQTTGV